MRGGVQVMHAHNAWLDVWLQLGILGLVVFGLLVVSTLGRSWLMATDRLARVDAGTTVGAHTGYSWVAMLPLLVLTAELVQSLAESRLLIEGGWILLIIFAVKTKLRPLSVEVEMAR
jgi:O-antigen ligase